MRSRPKEDLRGWWRHRNRFVSSVTKKTNSRAALPMGLLPSEPVLPATIRMAGMFPECCGLQARKCVWNATQDMSARFTNARFRHKAAVNRCLGLPFSAYVRAAIHAEVCSSRTLWEMSRENRQRLPNSGSQAFSGHGRARLHELSRPARGAGKQTAPCRRTRYLLEVPRQDRQGR